MYKTLFWFRIGKQIFSLSFPSVVYLENIFIVFTTIVMFEQLLAERANNHLLHFNFLLVLLFLSNFEEFRCFLLNLIINLKVEDFELFLLLIVNGGAVFRLIYDFRLYKFDCRLPIGL